MSTERELDQFLRGVERRAYKRALYAVRDADAALDVVQEAMISLARHYGGRPPAEWPMLFQRILGNAMMDWFRRQKARDAVFISAAEFSGPGTDSDFDILEQLLPDTASTESAEQEAVRSQWRGVIEEELMRLPARQRDAFLLRYWEELDVAQTAAALGCSEGSVKTHCSRAVHSLARALKARGMEP